MPDLLLQLLNIMRHVVWKKRERFPPLDFVKYYFVALGWRFCLFLRSKIIKIALSDKSAINVKISKNAPSLACAKSCLYSNPFAFFDATTAG